MLVFKKLFKILLDFCLGFWVLLLVFNRLRIIGIKVGSKFWICEVLKFVFLDIFWIILVIWLGENREVIVRGLGVVFVNWLIIFWIFVLFDFLCFCCKVECIWLFKIVVVVWVRLVLFFLLLFNCCIVLRILFNWLLLFFWLGLLIVLSIWLKSFIFFNFKFIKSLESILVLLNY